MAATEAVHVDFGRSGIASLSSPETCRGTGDTSELGGKDLPGSKGGLPEEQGFLKGTREYA